MANYKYVTETGVIIPETSELLEAAKNELRDVFGADLAVEDHTPQGVLAAAEASARRDVVRNNAALANQINPNQSGGPFLDALCALTGLERDAATRSVLRAVVVAGVPGTIVPQFSRARPGSAGPLFETIGAVVIGPGGTAEVDFRSVDFGPIEVLAGQLDTIAPGGVLGWETVTNPVDTILGGYGQRDPVLRAKRRNTLALQGVALSEAITSALYDVPGVRSLQFRENITNVATVIDGILLGPHSIWACVEGGTDSDIAQALYKNKSLGAGYNGAVMVPIVGTKGQVYEIRFDRPHVSVITVRVYYRQGTSAADPIQVIPDAIDRYANGDGSELFAEPGLGVGDTVSPFELASAVNMVEPGIFIAKVEISDDGGVTFVPTEIDLGLDRLGLITRNTVQPINVGA